MGNHATAQPGGNFSRDTYNALKHYVGVRLQQGVPLLDADWNEGEDVRKCAIEAFAKWFIGNGVPQGNEGFSVLPVQNRIILRSTTKGFSGSMVGVLESSVDVLTNESTAASLLGFDESNRCAMRMAPPGAQLTGKNAGPFEDLSGKILKLKADGSEEQVEVPFENQTEPNDVAAAINSAVDGKLNLEALAGAGNDFDIKGGTPDHPGRCLVDGWDVLNENNITYTGQALYTNPALADAWDVEPLGELTAPEGAARTDIVYLDVWEREVNQQEDGELANPLIGIETCVRRKREWVVRVAEGQDCPDSPPDGHIYYPLAYLHRADEVMAIEDLRRTHLHFAALLDEITDARGIKGNLGNRLDESLTKRGQLRHYVVGNEQVKGSAGIEESKIQFSVDGHDHSSGRGSPIGLGGLTDTVKSRLVDLSRIHKVPLLQQTVFGPNAVPPTLTVMSKPQGIAFDGAHPWVTVGVKSSVLRIDTATDTWEEVDVEHLPLEIAYGDNFLWLTSPLLHGRDGHVMRLSVLGHQVAKIGLRGLDPQGLAFAGGNLWVAYLSRNGNGIAKITSNEVLELVSLIKLEGTPGGVAFDGTHIWVALRSHGRFPGGVAKIHAGTDDPPVDTVELDGMRPTRIVFDGTHIWVADAGGNALGKIDRAANQMIATIPVGSEPADVVFDGTYVWAVNKSDNTVSKVDIIKNRQVATIQLGEDGQGPVRAAFDGTHIWVANSESRSVSKIRKVV